MAKVKISGNAIKVLDATVDKLKNVKPFLSRAALYQERSTKLNFAKESSPDGEKWAKLKASTLRRKRSGKILRETSALINSIDSDISGDTAIVSASQSYGIFHQTGTRKMDKREFLGISKKDELRILEIAAEMFI